MQVAALKKLLIVLCSLLIIPGWSDDLSAQEAIIRSVGGKSVQLVPSSPGKRPSRPPTAKKGAKPSTSTKPSASKGKKGAAKKADEASKTTQRPTKPEVPPNPKELELRPSDDGKMKLSFKGQPWPQLLEWLAKVSNMSLD